MRSACSARGDKDDRFAVGREDGLVVIRRVVSEALKARSVWVDAINVSGAIALRGEDDPLAIGGERWGIVHSCGRQKRAFAGTVTIRQEYLGVDWGGVGTEHDNLLSRSGRDDTGQQRRKEQDRGDLQNFSHGRGFRHEACSGVWSRPSG